MGTRDDEAHFHDDPPPGGRNKGRRTHGTTTTPAAWLDVCGCRDGTRAECLRRRQHLHYQVGRWQDLRQPEHRHEPWTGYFADAYVIGELAKNKLGCNVKYVTLAEQAGWHGMANGTIDTIVENWGHEDLAKKYITQQTSSRTPG